MNSCKQFGNMIVDEKTLLFVSADGIFPALYSVDLLNNKVECLGEIPWDNFFDENVLLGKIENVVIIAPRWHRRKFLKYDMKCATFQSIILEQEVWTNDFSISAFSNVVQFGNSLFFIGNKNGLIVEYEKESDQFYIHNIIFPKELTKEDLSFFWSSAYLIEAEATLYLPIIKGGLCKINLIDFHMVYINAIQDYQSFSMSLIDNQFWVMPYYGNNIMIYDLESEKFIVIRIPIKSKEMPFMTAVDFGKEILLIPMKNEKIFAISKSTCEVLEKQNFKLSKLKQNQIQRQFVAIYRDNIGNTYLQRNDSYELWTFNKIGIFKKMSFSVPFESIEEIFKNSKAFKKGFWIENTNIRIDFMIEILKDSKYVKQISRNYCGLEIWDFIKGEN